jgi:TonB family protein
MNKAVLKEPRVGDVIGDRFPLLEWLGGNDQAAVFRTEAPGTRDAKAVLKLVRAEADSARACLAAWEIAAGLSHPHLMRIVASGSVQDETGDLIYLVTEFAEESLSQIIPQRALSPSEVTEMLPPIVDALSFLHGRGFVYGELRPSNVLVVDNQIKLPLEGLVPAGTLAPPSRATRIYDAPETGALNASPAADAWSLGVTMIEALTQKPPAWNRSSNADPAVPPNLPSPLGEIARRCLRGDPARRISFSQIEAVLGGAGFPPEPANEPKVPKSATPVLTPGTAQSLGKTASALRANAARPMPSPIKANTNTPAAEAATRSLTEPISGSSNRRLLFGILLLVVMLAVIVFLVVRPHKNSQPSLTQSQSSVSDGATSPAATGASGPTTSNVPVTGSSQGAVVERVQPDVPERAMRTIRGKIEVTARLHVDASGSVTSATLERRGSSRYFATRALDAVRKWRFKAPAPDGHAVPSEWTVKFEFRRDGIVATPTEVRP